MSNPIHFKQLLQSEQIPPKNLLKHFPSCLLFWLSLSLQKAHSLADKVIEGAMSGSFMLYHPPPGPEVLLLLIGSRVALDKDLWKDPSQQVQAAESTSAEP